MKNKVIAANQIRNAMNAVMPQIVELLNSNPPKFNQDASLNKRAKDKIRAIIDDSDLPSRMRVFINSRPYAAGSLWISFDNNYPVGEFSVNYINEDVKAWPVERWDAVPTFELEDVEAAEQEILKLGEKARAIQGDISDIKRNFSPLLYL